MHEKLTDEFQHSDERPPSVASLNSLPFGRDALMMPNLYGDGEDYCEEDHIAHIADGVNRRHPILGYTDGASRNPGNHQTSFQLRPILIVA